MAVHLGATRRLECGLPRWISLIPAIFLVAHAFLDWSGVTLMIPSLIDGRLDGVDFARSVSISFPTMNLIDFHRWHAHNRIQKSVMVSKHIVLRSFRSQGNRLSS